MSWKPMLGQVLVKKILAGQTEAGLYVPETSKAGVRWYVVESAVQYVEDGVLLESPLTAGTEIIFAPGAVYGSFNGVPGWPADLCIGRIADVVSYQRKDKGN